MSSLFCGCCIRLFRRSDARSPNLLTVEPIGVPSDTSLGDNDHGTTNSVPDSPTSDSAHLVLNDSVPPVNFENMDQEVHSVVTTAIRLQDDRAEVDSTSTTPSRSGSLPTDVQPSDSGPISSSFISPHPAQEVRVAAETVSASDEPHVPSAVDELTELREKCRHFRVLVLGRANAGKTTLLKAVCGAAGDPKVVKEDRWGNLVLNDEGPQEGNEDDNIAPQSLLSPTAGRGEHNIETQLVFPSNPGFIFHDSRGFEAGSDEELKSVTEFIRSKGNSRELSKQLHVIWYCIPTDNEARLLSRPEQELLRECSAGPVPLVVIFTKFDSLEARVFHELKGTGLTRQQAQQSAPQHAIAEFQRNHLSRLLGEKPPKYICLKKMHKEQNNTEIQEKMAELIQHTVDAMGVDALKLLLVSVQRNNLQLTIEYAVKHGHIQGPAQEVFAAGNIVTAQQVERLIKMLLFWFGYIEGNNLETDQFLDQVDFLFLQEEDHQWHQDLYELRFFHQERFFYRDREKETVEAFHSEIYPHLATLVGSLPSSLHVPTLAIGILIVTAQLFWHAQGERPTASQIHEVMELYLTSGRADAVRAQVEEELGTITQHYTEENADGVIKIVMENLLGDH